LDLAMPHDHAHHDHDHAPHAAPHAHVAMAAVIDAPSWSLVRASLASRVGWAVAIAVLIWTAVLLTIR